MGQEQCGQMYSIDMENDIHDEAIRMRENSMLEVENLEKIMSTLSEEEEGALRTELTAAHMFHEVRAKKLSSYCIRQGLIGDVSLTA